MTKVQRTERLRHPRSQVEPAVRRVGHSGARGCDPPTGPVPLSGQEEELSDVEENGVDLDQQRHHSEAQVETARDSQTEAGDHLRQEWEHEESKVNTHEQKDAAKLYSRPQFNKTRTSIRNVSRLPLVTYSSAKAGLFGSIIY